MIKLLLHESKRRVGSPGVFITPGTYFILVSLFEFFDYIKVAKNAGAFLSRCSELLALAHGT